MFVRRKHNRSGSVSVVVVSKARGVFKEDKTIGVSSDADEIERLYRQGHAWIRKQLGLPDMFEQYSEEEFERKAVDYFFDHIENVLLNGTQIILNQHTCKILGGKIGLVFYDVTTLYFETDISDDLRKTGFSKDGKHAQPQIVLGLLVSEGGYPLAYSIHEGNKYEGHTMLPIVEEFVKKFGLTDFVIVADSGLMNTKKQKIAG